jgi:hypothetical protein
MQFVMVRFLAIFLGIAIILWIPFEDSSEIPAILFGFFISTGLMGALLTRFKHPSLFTTINIVIAGILTGASITPLILLLMVLKVGLHAHPLPDYSYEQFISIINRTPIWFISGLLAGIGFGIIIKGIYIRQEPSCAIEC